MLAEEENFAGLGRLNRALIGKAETMGFRLPDGPGHGSTEIRCYGEQEQSAYNGYFESTYFHPVAVQSRG